MKLSELKGKTVIAVAEAVKIGKISDVVVDLKYQVIQALVVKVDGNAPDRVIKSKAVQSIGQDAVTIDSTNSLRVFDQEQDLFRLPQASSMRGSRIVTESGKMLGTIDDIEFEPTTGQILSFLYDGTPLAGLLGQVHKLDPRYVISVGKGLVSVTDDAHRESRAA